MKRVVRLTVLIGMVVSCAACGAYKAVTQPSKVDIAELKSGQLSREKVIERLGEPRAVTRNPNGGTTERFEFYEGSDSFWKTGRGLIHIVGDLATYGAWELVATPIEFFVGGGRLVGEAEFDSEGRLTSFIVLGRDVKPREKLYEKQAETS